MKKIFTVLLTCTILLYSVALPVLHTNKAYADVLNPAAPYTTAPTFNNKLGEFLISILLAGSGATMLGQQKVQDKAHEIYTSMSDSAKSSMSTAWAESVAAHKTTVDMSTSFLESYLGQASNVSSWLSEQYTNLYASNDAPSLVFSSGYDLKVFNGYPYKYSNIMGTFNGTAIAGMSITYNMYRFYIDYSPLNGDPSVHFHDVAVSDLPPLASSYWGNVNDIDSLNLFLSYLGLDGIQLGITDGAVASLDNINKSITDTVDSLKNGLKEVDIPLDNWLAKTNDGVSLNVQSDGTLATDAGVVAAPNDVVWTYPDIGVVDTAVPTVLNPAVPITDILAGTDGVAVDTDTTAPTPPGGSDGTNNPFINNFVPFSFLMALLDLLRAILQYLGRMFAFIATIPLIGAKDINNPAFEWFKNAKIMGVYIYSVISSFAAIGFSFAIYKPIRRLFQ